MTEPNNPLSIWEQEGDVVKVLETGKKITLARIREIDKHLYFVSTNNEIFTEDELELHYSAAQSLIIFDWLQKWHLEFIYGQEPKEEDYDGDVFKHMFLDLDKHLAVHGYQITRRHNS